MEKPNISPTRRLKIQVLSEQGISNAEISRRLKISRGSVVYNLKKFKDTQSVKNRPRTGRNRITSEREDRELVRSSLRDRRRTSSELAAELSAARNTPISAVTVRRRLLEANLRGCKARKKPLLSVANMKSRYNWAKDHLNWTVDDWKTIIWSDESNIQVLYLSVSILK